MLSNCFLAPLGLPLACWEVYFRKENKTTCTKHISLEFCQILWGRYLFGFEDTFHEAWSAKHRILIFIVHIHDMKDREAEHLTEAFTKWFLSFGRYYFLSWIIVCWWLSFLHYFSRFISACLMHCWLPKNFPKNTRTGIRYYVLILSLLFMLSCSEVRLIEAKHIPTPMDYPGYTNSTGSTTNVASAALISLG